MVSKIVKFVEEHKYLVILSLGLTFDFSVKVSCNSEFKINFKFLAIVWFGYQLIKHIAKAVTKKHNSK